MNIRYKVVLDRQVGNHKLHKKALCIAAGNLDTDNALVEPMGTAMQSRLIHLEMCVGLEEWIDWAINANVDHKVISFVRSFPEALADFDPQHSDKTFSCPRTLFFLAKQVKRWGDNIPAEKLPVIVGTVGKGIGVKFFGYTKVYEFMPTLDTMLNNPDSVVIPDEPDRRYALSGMISNHIKEDNLPALLSIVDRLPLEFQVITIQQALPKQPMLIMNPEMRKRSSVITRITTDI